MGRYFFGAPQRGLSEAPPGLSVVVGGAELLVVAVCYGSVFDWVPKSDLKANKPQRDFLQRSVVEVYRRFPLQRKALSTAIGH